MSAALDLRYVPAWLSNVFKHYECDVNSFDSIVSKHDMKLYNLANYMLRAKLRMLGIDQDFNLPAANIDFTYDGADTLFALFGQNPKDLKVPDFELKCFRIQPDLHGGIWLIEDSEQAERRLTGELLEAISLYKGNDVAYGSACFKQFLKLVKNNPPVPVAGEGAAAA